MGKLKKQLIRDKKNGVRRSGRPANPDAKLSPLTPEPFRYLPILPLFPFKGIK